MLDKPDDMFDREREWRALNAFASSGQAGATLGVVSGRRRQGKTFLLEALCEAPGGTAALTRGGASDFSRSFLDPA